MAHNMPQDSMYILPQPVFKEPQEASVFELANTPTSLGYDKNNIIPK